jgi:galactokinase
MPVFSKAVLTQKFKTHFSGTPSTFAAPGRVNLIGEHTDYNDGYVFPMALNFYTHVAIAPRTDRNVQIWSENMHEVIMFSLDQNNGRRRHWSDYIAGIANELEKAGYVLPGADVYIESDVPVGSGLSSSAAIEMSTALAFLKLIGAEMPRAELARLGQRAENHFVGMNCGIMDQFISVHGEADHALLLDCRSLDYKQVPLPSRDARLVVCNTMVKHELGSSEYNKRRAECEEGVRLMAKSFPGITHLRDLSLKQFDSVQGQLPDIVRKRCRHVVSEDERVLSSLERLAADDLATFGILMNASHDSLRDDYEVSCDELDVMVDLARALPGCLGSRMTGGGFGGCTVNLVRLDYVPSFVEKITAQYKEQRGLDAKVYVTVPSRGAHEICE